MSDNKQGGALPMPDQAFEPIVAFYLTQETDLPAKYQGEYHVVTIRIPNSSGKPVKKPALRVTFSPNQSIEELVGLIGFGSDPRCQVLLPVGVVSSVHCRVYAQLNSGPQVWLVDDNSMQGTQVKDDEISRDKIVHGRRQAAHGLHTIRIGPYVFRIRAPVSHTEVRQREDWFRLNKPIPVTRLMLDRQLDGLKYDWLRMDRVGNGGFGDVYRYMEKQTALYVAIKEEKLKHPGKKFKVKKEVIYMETLHHPYLVDILFSECDEKKPVPTQYTAMPLYLGNLWDLLLRNPDIQTKERIVIQIFEGVSHMHENQVLHRDLKPENIFWVTESPAIVKVGDYGLATSLEDHLTLFETCGTTAYMAPEVFQKNILKTTAFDVFSLGATVFAILEHEIVMQGWYQRGDPPQLYNRVFENVARSPPKLYAGLVQSMMDPNPQDRPSLNVCIEVVKGHHYDWTKGTQLALVLAAAPITAVQHDTQGPADAAKQEQTPLDRARAWAVKRNLKPIAQGRQPENRQALQQAPVKHACKHQQDAMLPQEPQGPFPEAVAVQTPKPSKPIQPAPVQGVNFQDGLPSYEEATCTNPFARLVDSLEIAKNRRRSKLKPPQNIAHLVPEQRAKPVTQQSKKSNKNHLSSNGVTHMSCIQSAVQAHVSATHSRRSTSHSTSTTGARGQQPRNSRQITRRPREQAQALDIRRTGTGRIRKTTLTGITTGAIDMGRGLYQFGRGLGVATCNIGCLTGQGILMLYDLATKKDRAPNAALLLNNDERQLVATMRAHSLRREAERLRPAIVHRDKEVEHVQRMALARGGGLRRIREGAELG